MLLLGFDRRSYIHLCENVSCYSRTMDEKPLSVNPLNKLPQHPPNWGWFGRAVAVYCTSRKAGLAQARSLAGRHAVGLIIHVPAAINGKNGLLYIRA